MRRQLVVSLLLLAAVLSSLGGARRATAVGPVEDLGVAVRGLRVQQGPLSPDPAGTGVNGHQDLPVGGHQTSRPTDNRNPGGRTADLRVKLR